MALRLPEGVAGVGVIGLVLMIGIALVRGELGGVGAGIGGDALFVCCFCVYSVNLTSFKISSVVILRSIYTNGDAEEVGKVRVPRRHLRVNRRSGMIRRIVLKLLMVVLWLFVKQVPRFV